MSRALPVSMAVVATGTVIAQLINILGFMVATRFLEPSEFGMFGIHMAISTPLALLATGRYEVAFIRTEHPAKVINLFTLSISAAFFFTVVIGPILAVIFSMTNLASNLSVPLICGLLLGQAVVNCTTQLNNYNRSYQLISASRIVGAVGAQAGVLLLIWANAGHYALGIGMIVGFVLSAIVSMAGNSGWLRAGIGTISLSRISVLARRNLSYILFNGPQALASALQESAAVAVISAFFGHNATGVYVFSNRLMRAPISIVAESVGRVLQRKFGDMGNDSQEERARFLRASILYLSVFAIIFCVATWLLAKPVVVLLFSPEWEPLGDFIRASSPYYAIYLVAAALAPIPFATGNYRKTSLLGTIGSVLYVILLAIVGAFTSDLPSAFMIISFGMLLYFSAFIYTIYVSVIERDTP